MSRMVGDRERLAARVLQVVRSVAKTLGEELREVYASLLEEGEVLPDPVFRLQLDIRLVKQRTRRLREVHEAYRQGRINRKGLVHKRERLAGKLHGRLSGLRRIVDGEYGTGASAALLGIGGRTRRKHEPLLDQTRAVLLHVETVTDNPDFVHPFGVEVPTFDTVGWRARVESVYTELAKAAQIVDVADQIVVQLRSDRDQAIVAADEARRHVVNTAVSCCKLVGREDLAERVRRFSRRRDRPGPRKGQQGDDGGS